MLTNLLTQSVPNWELSEVFESKLIFKPTSTLDPTASIEFLPRRDNPEKAYALLKGKDIHPAGQELFFQKEIKPESYLDFAVGMYEMLYLDEGLTF